MISWVFTHADIAVVHAIGWQSVFPALSCINMAGNRIGFPGRAGATKDNPMHEDEYQAICADTAGSSRRSAYCIASGVRPTNRNQFHLIQYS